VACHSKHLKIVFFGRVRLTAAGPSRGIGADLLKLEERRAGNRFGGATGGHLTEGSYHSRAAARHSFAAEDESCVPSKGINKYNQVAFAASAMGSSRGPRDRDVAVAASPSVKNLFACLNHDVLAWLRA
jgi:hypothetical protein